MALTGDARGLTGVSLEAKTPARAGSPSQPLRPTTAGRSPCASGPEATTEYRLSAGEVRAALIEVAVAALVKAALAPGGVAGTVRPALSAVHVALQRQDGSRLDDGRDGHDRRRTAASSFDAQLTPGAYRVRCTPGHGLSPGVSAPLTAA